MYPTLSDLLADLFGVHIPLPIQTFGLMMAVSFAIAAYTVTLELKRKERNGLLQSFTHSYVKGEPASSSDLFWSAVIGFLIGFKLTEGIFHYSDLVNNPQEFILSVRGNIFGGIALAAYSAWSKYHEKEKEKLPEAKTVTETAWPHQMTMNIVIYAAVAGLLGAKIFHNLENMDDFMADPVEALLSFSGLTFYGGLICAAIVVIWYATKKLNVPALVICDVTAPGLMLSYGTGRIGCHLSGDGDWGIANTSPKPGWFPFPDWMWSYNYPHNVVGEGQLIPGCVGKHCYELVPPVFPTPFYEAVACILVFFVLWNLRKRISIPGILFFVYLTLNGMERLAVEQIRVNTKYHLFGHGITQAEILSTLMMIGGLIGCFYLNKRKKNVG